MQYIEYETSSSQDNPEQLFYYVTGNSYTVSNEIHPEYYIGFRLKKHVFCISSFSIISSYNPPNSWPHPKTWKILGSIDGKNWIVLNSHTNDNSLNDYGLFSHIETNKIVVRHLRFVSPTRFALYQLEFFGNLYPNSFMFPSPFVNYFHHLIPCFGLISAINLV